MGKNNGGDRLKYKVLKTIVALSLFLNSVFAISQNQFSYEYEKEIDGIENYILEDFSFHNKKSNVLLSGSLIVPKEDYNKVVIIIPGSGRDKRNSHYKLTKTLLDKGVAVLRYDDRGIGESQGNYITTKIIDFAEDLMYASTYLKERLPSKKIGAIGHSLGAQIVLEANSLLKKDKFDFIVILAGAVTSGKETSKHQAKDDGLYPYYQIDNEPKDSTLKYLHHINDIIYLNQDKKSIKKEVIQYAKKIGFKKKPEKYYSDYYIDIIKNEPTELYKKIDIPLYYIIGSEDRRIPPDISIEKLNTLNNKNIETLTLEGMGHFFTSNKEFYEIEPIASNAIVNWILKQE